MTDREAIARFLQLQYGSVSGTAWIGIEGRPFDHPFKWPEQSELMVNSIVQEDACGNNVWYCVHLIRGESRAKGNSIERRRLHVDLDNELNDEQSRKLEELGAWVVYSGRPGHVHAYVELGENVDVATYHSLERGLIEYLGGDKSKQSDNDYMRIPGTTNHMSEKKPYPPAPVTWDGTTGFKNWGASELKSILPEVALAQAEYCKDPIQPEEVEIPEFLREKLTTPNVVGQRSDYAVRIINACAGLGYSEGETLYVMLQDPAQRERFEEKPGTVYMEIRKLHGTYVAPMDSPEQERDDFELLMGGSIAPIEEGNKYERIALSLGQLREIPPPVPFVDELIYTRTICRLSGHPGAYKSYLAISLACAIASQEDSWGPYGIHRHGTVLYIAAEGASGLAHRIDAWCEENGVDPKDLDMKFLTVPTQFSFEADMQPLTEYINKIGAVFVVFDTQSRCTVGLDENSAKDMGLAVDGLERMMAQTNATAMILHHTTKEGSTARGSSVWEGAVWSELSCKRDGPNLTVHCSKHKDAHDDCDHLFYAKDSSFVALEPIPVLVPKQNVQDVFDRRRQILNVLVNELAAPWISIAELKNDWGIPKATSNNVLNALVKEGIVVRGGTAARPKFAAAERVQG